MTGRIICMKTQYVDGKLTREAPPAIAERYWRQACPRPQTPETLQDQPLLKPLASHSLLQLARRGLQQ